MNLYRFVAVSVDYHWALVEVELGHPHLHVLFSCVSAVEEFRRHTHLVALNNNHMAHFYRTELYAGDKGDRRISSGLGQTADLYQKETYRYWSPHRYMVAQRPREPNQISPCPGL
jgi:hypothetical protein